MTTQYNIVSYGTLTNTNGVLSNFSASNYATIPLPFNPVQRPYEIVFKINTETMPTDANGIIWQTGDYLTARGRLDLEVWNDKLYAELAANGEAVWNITGVTTLSSDTDYWVKLTYNGVNTYGLYLSTDGTTWTTEGTATSSGFLGDGTAEYNIIGVQPDEGGMIVPWFGSIDLNESYIDINNIRWWQGVTSTSNVQTRIQLRHDTAANWTSVNPVLLEGEVGIETDTLKQKVGDGVTAWNSLSYMESSEIFVAEYGTTTYQEVLTAYNAGKVIFCYDDNNNTYAPITNYTGIDFYFSTGLINNISASYTLDDNDIWDSGVTTVNNPTITFTQGGTTKGTITLNQSSNQTIVLDAGGTVDQTFDGTSQNAQSGVAIAGAGFLTSIPSSYLQNVATDTNALSILSNNSNGTATTLIGVDTVCSATAQYGTAIGYHARLGATSSAIQLGYGTNSTANSFNVGFYNNSSTHYNWQLLDGTTGLIPDARLSSNIARTNDIWYDSTSSTLYIGVAQS